MRTTYLLNRDWKFIAGDQQNEGNTHAVVYTSSKAGGAGGYASMDFDDGAWETVNLPHDFVIRNDVSERNDGPEGYKNRSVAWYRRSFNLPEECRDKHVFLNFEGIAVESEIFFNGSLMAHSFSGSVPVEIDVSDRAHYGDIANVISVRVDPTATEGWWYQGGGIYRDVTLTVKEPLHVTHHGMFIKPRCRDEKSNRWEVVCETTLENIASTDTKATVRFVVLDKEGNTVASIAKKATCAAFETEKLQAVMKVSNPRRWDIEDPYLYSVYAEVYADGVLCDREDDRIGFRTFYADPNLGFFLNGKNIKLKGVGNHHDHAGVGVAVPDALQYYRVKKIKEMGANAYRCAHHVHGKAIYDACDELGILVMDENRKFEADPRGLHDYEIMVKRARNHPSVVMYSLFNEEPLQGTPEGQKMYLHIKRELRKLDDSRLFTAALHGGYLESEGVSPATDVLGLNYKLWDRAEAAHRLFPNLPIFGAENNSCVTSRGCYQSDREDKRVLNCYDEEMLPWGVSLQKTWKFTRETPWFGGMFIWTALDHLGEPTPFVWPSVAAHFGQMDRCGFEKDGFYQAQACFSEQPILHLTPHWDWSEGKEIRVMPATNCEEVEIFVNGKSYGKKNADCTELPNWFIPFEAGCITAVGYIGGKEVIRTERKTSGKPKTLIAEPVKTELKNDGTDTLIVNFFVKDEKGNPVERADQLVNFEVIGDGEIIGVGNGDQNSHEPDCAPYRRLYEGRCQAIVSVLAGAKALTLRASAEGLEPAEIKVKIQEVPELPYLAPCMIRPLPNLGVSNELFTDKPNPRVKYADDDMNSFDPIKAGSSGMQGSFREGWRIYRSLFRVPKMDAAESVRIMVKFEYMRGSDAEFYLNGTLIEKKTSVESAVTVSFDAAADSVCDFRVLLHSHPVFQSGVKSVVTMQARKL